MYSNEWADPRIEVARIPRDSAGLLVRVAELDEKEPLVHVKTLAVALPAACKCSDPEDLHNAPER